MTNRIPVAVLRQHFGPLLKRVAAGQQLIVTRRSRPIARIVPEPADTGTSLGRYPLRGSVRSMASDFDAPLDRIWKALGK